MQIIAMSVEVPKGLFCEGCTRLENGEISAYCNALQTSLKRTDGKLIQKAVHKVHTYKDNACLDADLL